jgi:hypothetical protein
LRRGHRQWLLAVGLAGMLALGGGCSDDRLLLPAATSGTIEGYLTDGEPLPDDGVMVSIAGVGDPDRRFEMRVRVGADGHYAATVPCGSVIVSFSYLYRARVYHGRDGMTFSRAECETVQVTGETHRVDFACGRAILEVGLPAEIETFDHRCELILAGPDNEVASSSGLLAERRRYDFRLIPPGQYVACLASSRFGDLYLPASYDRDEAETLTVVAGEVTRHTSDLPPLGRVSGTVTGSSQVFGHDVRVHAWRDDGRVMSTNAAPDGAFILEFLTGTTFLLAISSDDIWSYYGGSDLPSATRFELAPGGQIEGLSHVESGLEVVIQGLPAEGSYHRIELFTAAGRNLGHAPDGDGYIPSSPDSSFQFSNLPAGEIYLSVTPAGSGLDWLPQFFDRRETFAEADPIAIPPAGQIGSVTVSVVTGGQIRGRIHGLDGSPPDLTSFRLELHRADSPHAPTRVLGPWDVFYNSTTGDYRLNRLADGDYKLHLLLNGYWTWWPAADTWDDATAISILDHGTVEGVDWHEVAPGLARP